MARDTSRDGLAGPLQIGYIVNVSLNIVAASTEQLSLDRRRRLVNELIEELVSTPREKMDAYRRWHRGSLSLVHLNVLTVLEAEGPISMGRLADTLDVSVASATGIVSRMTDRGVVERRHDAKDRRVVLVHLTKAGSMISTSLGEHHRERLGVLLEELSEPEMTGLLIGLRALHAARSRVAPDVEGVIAGGSQR